MSSSKVEPRTLRGFHDRLPKEAQRKEKLIYKLKSVFQLYGFLPIETPHLEYLEVLRGGDEGEISKQIFHFKDQGDRDVGLRFDLTVPLARFIAQHKNEVGLPFKRYAIGNVFRGERPQAGRYREFTQCDFDIVGTKSILSDAETLLVVAKSLDSIEVKDFAIKINHRSLMNAVAFNLGLPEADPLLRAIDKLDKIGEEGVIKELLETTNLTENSIEQTFNLFKKRGFQSITNLEDSLNQDLPFVKESLSRGSTELREIVSLLGNDDRFEIDLTIARGLGYYTGMVFETILKDRPELGSISSGGRYDDLVETFLDESIPGVGGSIGLDRLLVYLEDREVTHTRKILIPLEDETKKYHLFLVAEKLRAAKIPCEVFPEPDKIKRQFDYATRIGFSHLIFLNDDNTLRLRDAITRNEVTYPNIEGLLRHFID